MRRYVCIHDIDYAGYRFQVQAGMGIPGLKHSSMMQMPCSVQMFISLIN